MGVLQGLLSNNGSLYAAWKAEPDDDRLLYSSWNGKANDKWTPAAPMGGTVTGNSSAGPSLGSRKGSLYAAWKGEWSDPRLFYAKYDGTNWENQKQIPNVYSDEGPALCSLGTNLIAAWKNIFDQKLYFASYDGTNWSAQSPIAGAASSVGPSLALYDSKLYAVWKGGGTDQSLWYAHYDGHTWSGQTQIPGVGSSMGASLASVGQKLYAVWKGEGADQNLWYAYYDGHKWSGQTQGTSQSQIPGIGSSIGAAIAEFNGSLYAMCKGKDSDVSLYNSVFDGTKWHPWSNDIPGNTGPDTDTTLLPMPGPVAPGLPGTTNYWFIDSGGGGKRLTNAGVTLVVTEDIVPASNGNYSFQMNCWSPSPAQPTSCAWQQYGFRVANNILFFWVNNFPKNFATLPVLIEWDSRAQNYTLPLQNNVLPKGYQFTVTLINDANSGKVTGVSFAVTDQNNKILLAPPAFKLLTLTSGASPTINASAEAVIDSFMPVLVGENAGATTTFSSGQGIFLVNATNNLAATNEERASDSAVTGTKERSNTSYASLPASYPNGEFYQSFGI
jgi:hypothetical protein